MHLVRRILLAFRRTRNVREVDLIERTGRWIQFLDLVVWLRFDDTRSFGTESVREEVEFWFVELTLLYLTSVQNAR